MHLSPLIQICTAEPKLSEEGIKVCDDEQNSKYTTKAKDTNSPLCSWRTETSGHT